MPTLHWCKRQNNWFRSQCPDRDNDQSIQWTTFVSDEHYNLYSTGPECECSARERAARRPAVRRLP